MSDRIIVMNKGVIEQVAPPAEIYDRPKSRFVADFVGLVNFLEATVESADGTIRVGDDLLLKVDLPAGDHKRVLADIRPEHIVIGREGSGLGTVRGNVLRRYYMGDQIDYFVQTSGGEVRVTGSPLDGLFAEGEPVVLQIKHAFAFPL